MIPLLQKLFGMKSAQPEWLYLESAALKFQMEVDQVRVWQTQCGDGVGVYFFGMPPDLPIQTQPRDFLAAYRTMILQAGVQVVDCELSVINGLRALRSIIKAPQQPSGMTYIGAFTLAWRDFSYVVKVQCTEHGITGLREAALLERALTTRSSLSRDPADLQQVLHEVDVDSSAHDESFPDHPVSRVRRHLRTIADAIRVHDGLRGKAPFHWPH